MSDKLNRAKALEAEAKAIRRAERQFWMDVKNRRDEVLDFLHEKHKNEETMSNRDVASQSTEPYLF